jgi:hypothetical protein
MSLDWNLEKIADREAVCYVEDEQAAARGEENRFRLNPVTDAIIWKTMSVGMGQITVKNFEEFFVRAKMSEAVFGSSMTDGHGMDVGLTREDIRRHIGLSTNVSGMTEAQFARRLTDYMRKEAQAEERRQAREADDA